MQEDLLHTALLHHVAAAHDGHTLAGLRHHAQVMGDQDDAHVTGLLQILQQVQNLCLNGHVQRGGGLVGN